MLVPILALLALDALILFVAARHVGDDRTTEALQVLAGQLSLVAESGTYHQVRATGPDAAPDRPEFLFVTAGGARDGMHAGLPVGDALREIGDALREIIDAGARDFRAAVELNGETVLFAAVPFEAGATCRSCHDRAEAVGGTQAVPVLPAEGLAGLIAARAPLSGSLGKPEFVLEIGGVLVAVILLSALFLLFWVHYQRQHAARLSQSQAEQEVHRLQKMAEMHDRDVRLRAIVDNMGEALVTISEMGVVESVNPAARGMFGYSVEEIVGEPFARLVPRVGGRAGAAEVPRLHEFATRKEQAPTEVRGVRKNGERFPMELMLSEAGTGDRSRFVAIVRDLSASKLAETKVREAQTRLREAIEFLPDAFVVYDAEDRLLLCNQRFRDVYARSAHAIRPGVRFEDIVRVGVEAGQYADADLDSNPEKWIAEQVRLHREPPAEPIEQRLGDGRWLRVYERQTPDGQTVGLRIDITELKRREEALKLSESRLGAVVTAALDAIIVIDEFGRIREFNPAAERVFGYAKDEVMGLRVRELLVPERFRSAFDTKMRILQEAEPTTLIGDRVEVIALRKDGSEFLMEVAFNHVTGASGRVIIGFMRDITEERAKTLALDEARQRAEAASQAKANFLTMMSHEIRTPLNAVLGLLDLLLHTRLSGEQKKYIETARGSALALLQILNDILDFSRLEARRLEFVDAPFDPRALIGDVCDLFSARVGEKGLTLETEVDVKVPTVLVGDAGRIRQVLINLVANAVRHTARGGVRIELTLAPVPAMATEAEHVALRFSVADTGAGIAEQNRKNVFARFTTSPAQGEVRSEGVGLGLAISRELVEGMGGSIDFASRSGEGTRFWFDLGLARGTADALPRSEQGADAEEPCELEGARILLAEDNATNRMMTGAFLTRWGCRFETATNGAEVLEMLAQAPFDAVLMDVSMPVVDGIEATRRLRASGAAFADIPVVALTAHALVEERDRAMAAGMNAFVTKPVDSAVLRRALGAVLREQAADRAPDASPPGASPPMLIDPDRFGELIADLPEEVRDAVVHRCVLDLDAEADALDAGQQDIDRIRASSHVLVSLAATFGALSLAEMAEDVERLAVSGSDAARARAPELAIRARAVARDLERRRRERLMVNA
ncbi:PAS domain S-box protein [Stappia taiwanensis]|uniref:Sensory/regulatory protein RpfC n=1 Tax=Stappia taiwanensis TaxID=992267 RepID=A0A838XFG2_9HYPH|nr:PAS domain S-box protein [Stappia taiwanensis]MBA4610179.1 PAS domain S-box protein [Stappia taiwanensis]